MFGAQAAAAAAVIGGMKPHLALALVVVGITAAVLARPLTATDAGAPAALPAGPVTFNRDWSAPPCALPPCSPATVPDRPWSAPPPPSPDVLGPGRVPPETAFRPVADPLTRLRPLLLVAPASIQPTRLSAESAADVWSYGRALGPEPVPEPASWLLMLAGFALVGLGQRRAYLATL